LLIYTPRLAVHDERMDEHDIIKLLGFPDENVRGRSTMTSQIWRCDWCNRNYDFGKTLCALCDAASETEGSHAPSHVVHPQSGKPGLYDIYSNAKCPECGALWHRRRNKAMLIEKISHGRHHR